MPVATHAVTQTIPPVTSTAISSGGGGGSGGNGRPLRAPSDGGSAGASSAMPPDRKMGKNGGGGGGGGGDPGGDGDGEGGGATDRREVSRRPRCDNPSDSDREHSQQRKKKADKVKLPNLPRSAAEYETWYDTVVDAVTAAARDPNTAFTWVMRVDRESAIFEELGRIDTDWISLGSKIRVAISKHTNGMEADGHNALCAKTKSKRDELRKADLPRQISGLQLLWLVKRF